MSFALNAIDTADTYPEAETLAGSTARLSFLLCPDTVKLNVWVLNNGAFIQTAGNRGTGPDMAAGSANWRPEVFLPPGMYSFLRNIEKLRFRSSAAGLPANVTVEALVAGE
jgi:hypothetical protein